MLGDNLSLASTVYQNIDVLKSVTTEINLIMYIYVYRSSPHRAVNTLRLGYTNQSVNVV